MYLGKTVGIVVPAYNEELLIGRTLTGMPEYVDRIIVVNDGSKDRTKELILEHQQRDPRIVLVDHPQNKGLGQSLIDGYVEARRLRCDMVSVMAGDNQMSPADLPKVLEPVARGVAHYAKGNRLLHDKVIERMPTYRFIGNSGLTLLTKFATGYWHSMDPQCGYTAISLEALEVIPIERMIKGYGYNAHILYMLNVNNFTVKDVEIEPIYGEEKSKIKLRTYVPRVSRLLVSLFFRRLIRKYMLRDFHPLILFYLFAGFSLIFVSLPLLVRFVYMYVEIGEVPKTTLIILAFAATNALFSLFFAMWMDMEENERLWVRADQKLARPV
jgi:glycosyltransferase involved in cell wall biosynthesis